MRVVLDTNVLISACWKAASNEARVLERVFAGRLQACATQAVFDEYRRVIYRDKFARQRDCLLALLEQLAPKAHRVEPGARLALARDADDDRFLECAAAARAHFLVTGNLKHFPAEHAGTRVVNARGLLEALG